MLIFLPIFFSLVSLETNNISAPIKTGPHVSSLSIERNSEM